MKLPDLEAFHVVKAEVESMIPVQSERTKVQTAAKQHMRVSIQRTENALEGLVRQALDDLCYLREVLNAEKDSTLGGSHE